MCNTDIPVNVAVPRVELRMSRTVIPVLEINTGGERWDQNPFTNREEKSRM